MNRLLAVFGLFMLAAAVPAAPPKAQLTPEQLIELLGSESYAEREAAMTALEKSGPAAIPLLETASRDPNPEISHRAGQVLATLKRDTDTKDLLKVKTVRCSYKSMSLVNAVNELKKSTGINLALDSANVADPLRLVTVETGDLPPWEAVEAFCKATGLKEVHAAELDVPKQDRPRRGYYPQPPAPPSPDAVPVKLADGKYVALPGSRSSAVRVLALPGSFPSHRVYLGTGCVQLHFDIAPMPGINFRDVTGIRITKVVDDAGRLGASSTLKTPDLGGDEMFDGPVFIGGGRGMAMRWDGEMPSNPSTYPNPRVVPVPIKVTTLTAKTLKLLEGAVVCEVMVPNQALVTIDNISRNAGEPVEGAGGKMTVLEARAGEKGGKSILKVQTETPAPWLTSRRFNNPFAAVNMAPQPGLANQIKGFDAAGKPVRLATLTNSDISNDEFTVTSVIQFTCPDGLPTRLVMMGPKAVMVEVPFKLENVQLP